MSPPPEFVHGGTRDVAVLLLHGLTGTPQELHAVGEALAADGYSVHIPLLPGRGTCADDMDGLCWDDWMDVAMAAYDGLAATHRHVVVGGVSAGATMSLDLALRRRPSALLLYSGVLRVSNPFAYLSPYVWRILRRWRAPQRDFVDPTAVVSCYDPAPVRAMAELIAGIGRVRHRLGEIRSPALVAHAVADRIVPLASAHELAARLGGPVRTLLLEGTGHSITADAQRHVVAAATCVFLAQNIEALERLA